MESSDLKEWWKFLEAKNPGTFRGLAFVSLASGFGVLLITLPAQFWLNVIYVPSVYSGSQPTHFLSFVWIYSISGLMLTFGTFMSTFARSSFTFRWCGRAFVVANIYLLCSFSFSVLETPAKSTVAANALSFFAYTFLVWYSRILFWVSWLYCPGKVELKIQDIAVAILAGLTIVSRWADFVEVDIERLNPVFIYCGATAIGLLLAKYTYELIELVAGKK